MIYTGIGSRKTPPEVLSTMEGIGRILGEIGWTLRSGHADGADLAFETGAAQAKGKMEIFLPWEGFNGGSIKYPSYLIPSGLINERAMELAMEYHPNWFQCSWPARKLHARNCYQVLGADLQNPTQLVICWTEGGRREGGTGQALRIAEAQSIPIFDLAVDSLQQVEDFINSLMENDQ